MKNIWKDAVETTGIILVTTLSIPIGILSIAIKGIEKAVDVITDRL